MEFFNCSFILAQKQEYKILFFNLKDIGKPVNLSLIEQCLHCLNISFIYVY